VEIASIFEELWRRRWLVVLGALLAAVIGFMALKKANSESTRVGLASQVLVLDTIPSQIVAPAPKRVDNLSWQSMLAGFGMASAETEKAIAGKLGLDPNELVITVPRIEAPARETPLPTKAAEVAATHPEPYVLSVGLNPKVPMISLNATAPTVEAARRLTAAGTSELRALPDAETGRQIFTVDAASQVTGREIVSRPRRMMALAAAAVFFGLWCAGLLIVPAVRCAFRGGRHTAGARAAAG
jgi:hypothetical protein